MGFMFSKPRPCDPKSAISDLTGKVVIITGANTGIGYQTAEQLALRGAKVYLACRTESKARTAIADIERALPTEWKGKGRLMWLPLDLSSIHNVQKAAEEFLEKEERLDILVNNAGRMADDYVLTSEGVEQSVAVNHLGHFVFNRTLLPVLKDTAKLPGTDVRLVIGSSDGYRFFKNRTRFESLEDFNDRQGTPGKENGYFTRFSRYCIPITVLTLSPGFVLTEQAIATLPVGLRWLPRLVPGGLTPLQGAFTTLFAATSAEVAAEREKYNGGYLQPFGRLDKLQKEALDVELAQNLWRTTEKVVANILATPAEV